MSWDTNEASRQCCLCSLSSACLPRGLSSNGIRASNCYSDGLMLMLIEPHITLPHKEDTITQYSMQLVLVEKGQTSLVATYCIDQMVLSLYWHSSFGSMKVDMVVHTQIVQLNCTTQVQHIEVQL